MAAAIERNVVSGAKSPRARKAGTGTAKKPRCQSLFFADVLLINVKRAFCAGNNGARESNKRNTRRLCSRLFEYRLPSNSRFQNGVKPPYSKFIVQHRKNRRIKLKDREKTEYYRIYAANQVFLPKKRNHVYLYIKDIIEDIDNYGVLVSRAQEENTDAGT
jgi:hypothetical protein